MHGWPNLLVHPLTPPDWAINAFFSVVVALVGIRGLVWVYCLVVAVRAAVREQDNERGERALKVVDKLLRWFPFRR